jgi:UDP-glucose 4-epimerase
MILVTGGSGFIGTHLVRELCRKGEAVRNMDIRKPKEQNGEYFKGDVRKGKDCELACEGCGTVMHLAAIADVAASIADPAGNFQTNAVGTVRMVEAAKNAGVKRFVYASSAAVYGPPHSLPISESHPANPISPYGLSKLAAEKFVLMHPAAGPEPVALRYFNVYGPGQDPQSPYSGVMTKFADAIRKGEGITVFGDGLQTRDFVHVADVVQATMLAASAKGCVGKAVNIGSGKEVSIGGMARMMIGASGKKIGINYEPKRSGDIEKSVADVSLAKNCLGFEPKMAFEKGVSQLLQ